MKDTILTSEKIRVATARSFEETSEIQKSHSTQLEDCGEKIVKRDNSEVLK
jgi:hypothetical protein